MTLKKQINKKINKIDRNKQVKIKVEPLRLGEFVKVCRLDILIDFFVIRKVKETAQLQNNLATFKTV